ncbi:hypothetical protein K493DRAFT_318706 [Basidiobolus meristosporus CBS 931.73]|uniref:3-oxo-5-alpha-steroid 4-dehydrogenase C-terminal domain-containing protein n=1 Tax=Basidiobolus meristosporus CBS 931.73 TaxID=1314790 RepID=A0A1Y1XUH7_9FUNG|nr:hypothetical protein K493DRAFT_318706 [Basidiobolus meristosporus CBS 931.73]|eukprot:ORX89411.1 hypothetical protein K493DRAFT_318706 [Basidiobolus meristosporus CBS 931.73]
MWNLWLLLELTGWLCWAKRGLLLSLLYTWDTPTEVDYLGSAEIALYALVLTQLQLARRTYEVFFVEKPSEAKMHLGHYLVGLCFYLAVSLSVWLEAAGNLGLYSTAGPKLSVAQLFTRPVPLLCGTVLFGYFSYRQYRCHLILAQLRPGPSKPGPPKYFIPRGDLFEYVTGAHYFCEIMIYFALWWLVGLTNITMGLSFSWVLINLGIIARETHGWYQSKFGASYPPSRRILFPFLY